MSNANPSRVLQVNGAGDVLAIGLKQFSGEVLSAFTRESAFDDKVTKRTISAGKSAQFPAIGLAQAYTHTPGDEILGQSINSGEVTISLEGLQVAPIFVASIDDFIAHFDYRRPYSEQMGQALAKLYDQNNGRTLIAAARTTTPNVNGVYAGDTLTSFSNNAAYANDGAVIFQGVYDAGVTFDQRDIPQSGRSAVFRPLEYALLVKSEKPFDYRLNDGETGLGGYARGTVKMVNGIPIFKTNNLPGSDDRALTNQPTSRQLDFSVTKGLISHPQAAGVVSMQDITMEAGWDMRRQGWLMLGKYFVGHGKLRPEAAFELRTGAPS